MLKVRVEIKGDKKAIAQLRKMLSAFENWTPELTETGEFLKSFFSGPTFVTEGGIFGARWQALSAAYAIRKAVKYPGAGILEASGALRKSYQKKVYPNLLELINDDPKASLHHEGRGRLPIRLVMRVDEQRKSQIVDIFKKGALIKIQKAINSA